MKTMNYPLLFIFFLTINLVQAQDEKQSKFNIISYGGIGYGTVENDIEPNYNLNSSSVETLVNYRISQEFGIATGVGMNEMTGNGFNSNGNFYHERTMLKVPLVVTMDSKISEKLRVIGNFGFYGQNITKDEYRFTNNTQKDLYQGWNFGAQLGIGFVFEMFDNVSAGIMYSGRSDFSKFESTTNQGFNDKQKIKNLNSIGLTLMIEL